MIYKPNIFSFLFSAWFSILKSTNLLFNIVFKAAFSQIHARKKGLTCLSKSAKNKISYFESETEFSFAINSVSDLDSASESDSESAFINLGISIFFAL